MERKIRKLRKIELLELLLEQEKEIEGLREQVTELQKQLDVQKLQIENAGSIAEAAMQLSGIFEAAQKAADLYLKSVKGNSEDKENIGEDQKTGETVDSGDRGGAVPSEGTQDEA